MKKPIHTFAILAFLSGCVFTRATNPFDLVGIVLGLLIFGQSAFLLHQLGGSVDSILAENERMQAQISRLKAGGV